MTPTTLFLALRQLWSRRWLYGIATIGVMLGVFPLIAISGILRGFQGKFVATVLKNSAHVVLFDKELRRAPRPLDLDALGPMVGRVSHEAPEDREIRIGRPGEILRAVERMRGVQAASVGVLGTAILGAGTREVPIELRGIDPLLQERVTPLRSTLTSGDFRAFVGSSDGVLLGAGVARNLGAKVGDTLSCASTKGAKSTLKVAGIFETSINAIDKARAYVPLRVAQTILGKGDAIERIEIRVDDPDRADVVADRMKRVFKYDAESWQEANANFLALFAQQNFIIGFVIAALLAVGGFGILSIQIMIVLQKRRDIAILRSVGFRRSDILAIVLVQGMIVAGVGALGGAVAGHLVLDKLRHTKVTTGETFLHSDTWNVHESPEQYGLALAFAILVGLGSSVVPALQASRVEPVDVLRGQT